MQPERKVYLLDPQKLSPETIAVVFAKTSRSPLSFNEIASSLTDEKSAQFHEKWVVGYGHASVAEHAVLHIAIENISRLAIEALEATRLASFTEKSTRYQEWDQNFFHTPAEITNHPLRSLYEKTCRLLFDTYLQSINAVKAVVKDEYPQKVGENENAWNIRIRSKYVDVCRFLLPASSLANVGATINARSLEHTIRRMLSNPLEEVRKLGQEVKEVALAEVPTLVKYANPVPYINETNNVLSGEARKITEASNNDDWCKLIDFDPNSEHHILAAALYRFGDTSYSQALNYVQQASFTELQQLANILLGKLGEHDIPLRELEHSYFTFDLILDQGAYFELKRHRMMTQTPQRLTTSLGYAIPSRFQSASFLDKYCNVMDIVQATYEQLAEYSPIVASYIVPNGFKRRVLITLNLRTAFHLISLRSAPNAHFSIRLVALRIAEIIREVSPILSTYMKSSDIETWKDIESSFFL